MTFKCIFCQYVVDDINKMGDHYDKFHHDLIPEDMVPNQFAYYTKTGKTHGRCTECHRDTKWNTKTNKYHRLCGREACRKAVEARANARNMSRYGKEKLLDSRERQEVMLSRRRISGEYHWSTGNAVFKYVGSYELDFLKFMDLKLNWDSADLFAPAPQTFSYTYEGKEHFYIPDIYIPSIKTFVEIKDGDPNNPNHHANMHPDIVAVNRVKERLKDEVMNSLKDYHYIKIYNKEYDGFLKFLKQQSNVITEAAGVFQQDWFDYKWDFSPTDTMPRHRAFHYILKNYRDTILSIISAWEAYVDKNNLQKLTITSKRHNDKIKELFGSRMKGVHETLIDKMHSDEFKYSLDEDDKMITPNKSLIPDTLWDFSARIALIDSDMEISINNHDDDVYSNLVGNISADAEHIDTAMIKVIKKIIPYYLDLRIDPTKTTDGMITTKINLYTLPKDGKDDD